MSMELKLAQGKVRLGNNARPNRPQGDPGLFGFIGDVVKKATSFVRDPVGTVTGFIGEIFGEEPAPVPISIATRQPIILTGTAFAPQEAPTGINFPFMEPPGVGIDLFGNRLSFGENGNGNGARPVVSQGKCQTGWHPNKSSYFLRNGTFIQKGSVCVRNRRRNDFNGRAISNSMKRLTGAKKASKMIGRVTIRCGKCPGKCTCR